MCSLVRVGQLERAVGGAGGVGRFACLEFMVRSDCRGGCER